MTTLEKVEGNAPLVTGDAAKRSSGGLASTFIARGLVDEHRLFVSPVILGAGTPHLPALAERINLELAETRTFGSRVVYLRYERAEGSAVGS